MPDSYSHMRPMSPNTRRISGNDSMCWALCSPHRTFGWKISRAAFRNTSSCISHCGSVRAKASASANSRTTSTCDPQSTRLEPGSTRTFVKTVEVSQYVSSQATRAGKGFAMTHRIRADHGPKAVTA